MASLSPAEVFDKNDLSYQTWLKANSDGYVLNSRRAIDPSYFVLHRASCPHIRRYTSVAKDGAFTERGYIKICSSNLSSLRLWVKNHGRPNGSFSKECGFCNKHKLG